MKGIIVINKQLGMKPGKISRVCAHLGFMIHHIQKGWIDNFKWVMSSFKLIVLKSDNNYNEILDYLKSNNIKHYCHIDKGRTSVAQGSNCGVVFFCKEGEHDIIERLKLL